MEKQRRKSKYRLFIRLLILGVLFFNATNVFSQSLREKINSLEISPAENQDLYIKSDIKFEVELPDVNPNSVQVRSADFGENVNLKSLRKSESIGKSTSTKIEFWLSFDKVGVYKFAKLPLLINGRTYYIRVKSVEIEENPENLNPRVVVVFNDGTTLYSDDFYNSKYFSEKKNEIIPIFDAPINQKLEFTVYLQYGVQLIQFEWELPKNSIFTQTKQYEITEVKYRENVYSKELEPIASFEWTGLVEEKMSFPKIKVVSTSYKGYKSEIIFPSYEINFVKSDIQNNKKTENSIFDDAFDFSSTKAEAGSEVLITSEISKNIAELRIKERNSSLDYFINVKNRKQAENFFGFDSTSKEFPVKLFYVCVFMFLLFVFVLILCIKHKRAVGIIFVSVMLALCLIASVFCVFKSSKKYGICVGGVLQSVPEESASSKFEITGGNRVLISERSGEWVFIEYGDISGWIKEEFIIFIK